MRALVVHAGPQFSVMDVANGWVRGLQANGVDVMEMDLHNALWYFSNTFVERDGEWIPGMSIEQACFAAGEQVQAYAFRWLPDVTFIVSGFFLNEFTVQLLRARGSKIGRASCGERV